MKTKILIIFCFCSSLVAAQQAYVDPVTTGALAVYSAQIKRQQLKTIKEQKNLKRAQLFVAGLMTKANSIQNKIYKGLSEVSGTLKNAMQLKQIYQDMQECYKYTNNISTLVKENPAYAVFEVKASQKAVMQLVRIGTEVTGLMTTSPSNLATSGDRYKILFQLQDDVKKLKLWLFTINYSLETAIQIGFWKTVYNNSPFSFFYTWDAMVVHQIIRKYNYLRK